MCAFAAWRAGDVASALRLLDDADREVDHGQGWHTQATRSLAAYVRASATADPAEVLRLLGRGVRSARSLPTVGALVARFALMRMRALLTLGEFDASVGEARAVIGFADYNDYVLHLQHTEQEFPLALVEPMRVTAEDYAETQAVIDRHGATVDTNPVLHEGVVVLAVS